MKTKWIRGFALLCVVAMLVTAFAACGEEGESSENSQVGPSVTDASNSTTTAGEVFGDVTTTAGEVSGDTTTGAGDSTTTGNSGTVSGTTATQKPVISNNTGKTYQNMNISTGKVDKSYRTGSYEVQDLGLMQMADYPIDGVYDSAFNIIKVGDTYKMWWCRACPFDTIWYAESKDLKNWTNQQCIIDLEGYRTTWIKEMLAWSSVLYVNGKYHMFFEAPAEIADSGEYSNNIFYATSGNGIDWTFYPNNKDPQPVIKNPNVKEGVYGVGQPKAFYKDGYFYVVYTDASNSGGDIRVARSKGNGFSFEGSVATHTKIMSGIAGAAVRYNSTTKKYYFVATVSETQSNGVYNDNIYMMESDDLMNWPCNTRARLLSQGTRLSLTSEVRKKGNADFVTDDKGVVSGEAMYFVYMNGLMPAEGVDHRITHNTWDGDIMVVKTPGIVGKSYTLPNGKPATDDNLNAYGDRIATWVRPKAEAAKGSPKIDGSKDSLYNGSTEVKVETVTYNYTDCQPTDTTGSVYFAWDNDALYMYATVKDATGPHTNTKLDKPDQNWRNDGITLFVDVPNTMTGTNNGETLTPLTNMITIDAAGTCVFKDGGENNITNEFDKPTIVTKKISGGYVIEAKIPWYSMVKSQIKSGKTIGLDVEINDHFGTDGDREAQILWSDYTCNSFRLLDKFGELKLK